jgi:hypothetical protein
MTEAAKDGKGWFDPRITISGMVQIILLLVAIFQFAAKQDKRTSLVEQTIILHSDMIKNLHDLTVQLAASNQRVVTIIEQYQRTNK